MVATDFSASNLELIFQTCPTEVQSTIYIIILSATFMAGVIYRYPIVLLWMYQGWTIVSAGFKSKRIKVKKNYQFSYIERGSMKSCSSSVLMLPGFSCSKDNFCDIAKSIPKEYHIISIDMPGHGETTKMIDEDFKIQAQVKRIKQFVDATRLARKKFHIVGTSMGGHVAGAYAARYPRDVKSVSMLCPAGLKAEKESEMIRKYFEEGRIFLLPETVDELMEMLDYVIHRKFYYPRFFLRGLLNDRKASSQILRKILFDICDEKCRYSLEDSLSKIKIPVLVIWGREDKTLDVSGVSVVKAKLPKAQINILEDCGHSIFLERPKEAGLCLKKFLASV